MPRLAIIAALLLTLLPIRVAAHALEPGFLELAPIAAGQWRVTWRKPQVQGRPMPIEAILPESCSPRQGPEPIFDGRAFVSGWLTKCKTGVAGGEIQIDGLDRTRTEVLVRYSSDASEPIQAARLTANEPSFVIPERPQRLTVFSTYSLLGIDHILSGVDHLLFVLMLIFLVSDIRKLLLAVTSFTVAHSITLAAASLGWIVIPAPPVEAVIALSIAFLAAELLHSRDGGKGLTLRYPWVVTFAFGLLHGLGFASALREIGLPETDVPLALFSFNFGVEAGQILFIAMVLSLGAILARIAPAIASDLKSPGSIGRRGISYGVGTLAAFWVVERISVFV